MPGSSGAGFLFWEDLMEITNDSGQDTRYKVTNSGGGSGMDPHRYFKAEEVKRWPVLRNGESVNHAPVPPGPWHVHFVVNGEELVKAAVKTSRDRIRLGVAGKSLKA